jgi:hypothetical protein
MSTEMVIILGLFAFILFGVFVGDNGPKATFRKASPLLGAKLEKHIETGPGFTYSPDAEIKWGPPQKEAE